MAASAARSYEVEVPGRVCLFGEHSDWAGSYRRTNSEVRPGACIVIGTDQTLQASAQEHPDKLIMTSTGDDGTVTGPWECSLDEKELLAEAQKGGFWSYAAGVAYQIMIYYPVKGLRLNNHTTTLPMKKGLSSSAAFCVLISRAFNVVYNLRMTVRAEMELAYLGEILTPSRCGRMDQCCAFGKTPTLMQFDGPLLQTTSLTLPSSTLYLVVVDLNASKDTKTILASLNKAYPFPSNPVEEGVQRLLGPLNEDIIQRASQAIHDGDAEQLGKLMTEAQAAFDQYAMPACPQQLTSPVLHTVLTHPKILPHIYGAKGVGSQGDGCAQMVAKSLEDQQALLRILSEDLHMRPFPLTMTSASPVKSCVILCAEPAPALFPASLASPPALFPILDSHGVAKPAVLFAVEEAINAGLEEVLVVVPALLLPHFEALFASVPFSQLEGLPQAQLHAARQLHSLASKVKLVAQPAEGAGGTGRGLLACKGLLAGQSAVVVLHSERLFSTKSRGDSSDPKSHREEPSLVSQLLDRFTGTSLVSLQVVEEEKVGASAVCVSGQVVTGSSDSISQARQAETPPPHLRPGDLLRLDKLHTWSVSPGSTRRDSLTQPGLEAGRVLALSGHGVVCEAVFEALETVQKQHPTAPLELASGLEQLRSMSGLQGMVTEGRGVDLCEPAALVQAATLFI